ncbi:MAG: hypothetical protein J6B34_04590 [Clostridia bacterium]|nr:hypothetical protein [Clostridia bacterium]
MVSLNSIFSSNMIMQANKPVRLFGQGEGNVKVLFNGEEKSVVSNGKWIIEFDCVDYGGPYIFDVMLDDRHTVIDNVYFGDVYLLAGQSNMQFKLWESNEPKENYKGNRNVRLFTVDRVEDGESFLSSDGWVDLTLDTAPNFSAIGYYVAQALASDSRKIGLIACYQGASVIQSWMRSEVALRDEFQIEDKFADHEWFPIWNENGFLYDKMLSKIIPYSLGGVLWYQGESNASLNEARIYLKMLEAMISSWREDFKDSTLPFIVVQMADYLDRDTEGWHLVQKAQLDAQDYIPYVKSVICRDVCDNIDIHPKEKDVLSQRIASLL